MADYPTPLRCADLTAQLGPLPAATRFSAASISNGCAAYLLQFGGVDTAKAEGSGLHRGRGGNQREARSRLWKLWTGPPSGVSLPAHAISRWTSRNRWFSSLVGSLTTQSVEVAGPETKGGPRG